MSTPTGYSRAQIWLHWGIAVLIVIQVLFHDGISEAWEAIEKGQEVTSFAPVLHVIPGVLVLVLVLVRIFLRVKLGAPAAPEGGSPLLDNAAKAVRLGLYILLLLIPLSGMAAWFGGISQAAETHELFFQALLALTLLHSIAALYHHYVLKDGLLDRMKKPG